MAEARRRDGEGGEEDEDEGESDVNRDAVGENQRRRNVQRW